MAGGNEALNNVASFRQLFKTPMTTHVPADKGACMSALTLYERLETHDLAITSSRVSRSDSY